MGGDEVSLECWLSDPKIVKWAKEKYPKAENPVEELQAYWLNNVQKMVTTNGRKSMVWEEAYVNGTKLDSDTIVQIWQYRVNGNNAMILARELQGLTIEVSIPMIGLRVGDGAVVSC